MSLLLLTSTIAGFHRRVVINPVEEEPDISGAPIYFSGIETSSAADNILYQSSLDGDTWETLLTVASISAGNNISRNVYGNDFYTSYYWRVISSNEDRQSPILYDPATFLTIPEHYPSGLSAVTISHTQNDLTWVESDGHIRIYRDGVAIVPDLEPGSTTYSDIEREPATVYTYQICAVSPQVPYEGVAQPEQVTTLSPSITAITNTAPLYFTGYYEDLSNGEIPDVWIDASADGGYWIPNFSIDLYGQTSNLAGGPVGGGDGGWSVMRLPIHPPVDEAHYSWRCKFDNSTYGTQVVELSGICVIHHNGDSGGMTIRKPDPSWYFADRYNSGGDIITTTTENLAGNGDYCYWLDVEMVNVGGTMKAQVRLIASRTTTKPTILDSTNSITFDSTAEVQPIGISFHRSVGSRLFLNHVRGAEFVLGDAV